MKQKQRRCGRCLSCSLQQWRREPLPPRLESGNAGRSPACVLTALPSIKAAPKANCAALQAQGLKKQIDCEIRRPTACFSRTQHFQHGSPWIVDLILKTGFQWGPRIPPPRNFKKKEERKKESLQLMQFDSENHIRPD